MTHDSSTGGERLISVIDEHWIKYLMPVFIYALLLGIGVLLFVLAGVSSHHYVWLSHIALIAGLALMLLAHHWFFLSLLSEALDCLIITSQRSIHFDTKLLFHDEIRENSLDKMRTVEASKEGLLQNILNYGTLRFQGGDEITMVPHPNSVARDIEQAMGRM